MLSTISSELRMIMATSCLETLLCVPKPLGRLFPSDRGLDTKYATYLRCRLHHYIGFDVMANLRVSARKLCLLFPLILPHHPRKS